MTISFLFSLIQLSVLAIGSTILSVWLFLVVVTFWLALATWCRQRLHRHHHHQQQKHHLWRSGLYRGKVGHVRFHPRRHSFSYPLYIFLVDLEEVDDLLLGSTIGGKHDNRGMLWPLSYIVSFRVEDHMKHDPTLRDNNDDDGDNNHNNNNNINNRKIDSTAALSNKIFQIVQERNINNRTSGQQQQDGNHKSNIPSPSIISTATHRILLATQLCYWGYCFNPVSFYYLQNKSTHRIDLIIAEVSNTPWGEMHHYVLRQQPQQEQEQEEEVPPEECDNTLSTTTTTTTSTRTTIPSATTWNARNYKFDKTFHVSPFMEMHYLYDWTFQEEIANTDGTVTALDVVTSMRDKNRNDRMQFTARMQVQRQASFGSLVMCLLQYPMFCLIIQLWIHYEAFWLFVKGIPYIPHPTGSETIASRVIGTLMIPLFAAQDAWKQASTSLFYKGSKSE